MTTKKSWTREELERGYVGKMTTVTVPVNISFQGGQRVLDLSEVEAILKDATLISQQECDCRKKMRNCMEPMDGCLSLDEEARDMIENHGARKITVEEGLQALKRTHEAGFVHMAYTMEGQEEAEIICSCCICCCHSLAAALEFGYPDHVFSSKLIAAQDEEACTNCGTCVPRCQFGARAMVEEKMAYERERCFGCGLCVTTCPEGAIEMVERTAGNTGS